MGVKIIKIYEPTSSDGYHSAGDGIYFLDKSIANAYAKQKHGNYSSNTFEHLCIEIEKEKYLKLESDKPIVLANSEAYKTGIRKTAMEKLSDEEKEILGLK